MAGQAPSRRQLLQALAYASLASGACGFCRWKFAFAEDHAAHIAQHANTRKPAHALYRPRCFSPEQFATVTVLAELILPRTPSMAAGSRAPGALHSRVVKPEAGATDAGVAEFIDFMASKDEIVQLAFTKGLAWLDQAASIPFRVRTVADKATLLDRIAYRKNFRTGDEAGQEFFLVARRLTVIGFYTSLIGLQSLNFPGLQFYGSYPAIPQDGSLQRLGV